MEYRKGDRIKALYPLSRWQMLTNRFRRFFGIPERKPQFGMYEVVSKRVR